MKYLISGTNSGLGKFIYNKLKRDSIGLNRNNRKIINKYNNFHTIIHCAFNKENEISDYSKYIDDNILLTNELLNLKFKKFIYISSVDIYSNKENNYIFFKKLSESLVFEKKNTLILRCSSMIGQTMKSNHLQKIKSNSDITLSSSSSFNYILMKDIFKFIINDAKNYSGLLDFVANKAISLKLVSKYFDSKTVFGKSRYITVKSFKNPIYKLDKNYDSSSLQNLNRYFKKE